MNALDINKSTSTSNKNYATKIKYGGGLALGGKKKYNYRRRKNMGHKVVS